MQSRAFLTFIFLSVACSVSSADNLSFTRNARTFETQQASLIAKSMAFSCLALSSLPDGLPCNPAFTPTRDVPKFGIEGLISNGYSTLEKMRKLLAGTVDQDLINALFSGQNVLQIEGNAELDFMSKYINARYTPVTVKYFSVVRNEANPQVDLYAVTENNFSFQSGIETFKNLYIGLQVRTVARQYVRQEFPLLTLTTQSGQNILKPENQQATYFEPGIAYQFKSAWNLTLAAMVANLGMQSGDFQTLPEPLEAQFAVGISPEVSWGNLEFELDYRSMNYQEQTNAQLLHLGGLYHLGTMYLSAGLDTNGSSMGIFYGLQEINAGIVYSTTKSLLFSDDYFTQTVYVQVGWQI